MGAINVGDEEIARLDKVGAQLVAIAAKHGVAKRGVSFTQIIHELCDLWEQKEADVKP
jgi:hypothetical protein